MELFSEIKSEPHTCIALVSAVPSLLVSTGINSTANPSKQIGAGALASITVKGISIIPVFPQPSPAIIRKVCEPIGISLPTTLSL